MAQYDVEAFIDRQPIGAAPARHLGVCSLVCFIDGFDIFMVGKIAPAIAKSFGETPAAMRELFLFQQIGLAIGAFTVAPIADRLGRRTMLVVSATLFGLITLTALLADNLTHLSILRGIGAVFMSAGLPMALALLAEMTPKRRRSTFMAIALACYSTGSAASGAVAAFLIDDYGWQSGFLIGGLVPLLCVPLLLLLVPESLKYRTERDPADPAIARTIARMDPSAELTGAELFNLGGSAKPPKARLFDIFSDGRAGATTILWICCFVSMSNIAIVGAWLPTFFQEMAGIPIQAFAITAMIAFLGGFAGTLAMGWLMDRFQPSHLIAIFYVGICVLMFSLSQVPFGTPVFLGVFILWSFFSTGGQAGPQHAHHLHLSAADAQHRARLVGRRGPHRRHIDRPRVRRLRA